MYDRNLIPSPFLRHRPAPPPAPSTDECLVQLCVWSERSNHPTTSHVKCTNVKFLVTSTLVVICKSAFSVEAGWFRALYARGESLTPPPSPSPTPILGPMYMPSQRLESQGRSIEVAALLEPFTGDVTARDRWGNTSVHLASAGCDYELLKFLARRGNLDLSQVGVTL